MAAQVPLYIKTTGNSQDVYIYITPSNPVFEDQARLELQKVKALAIRSLGLLKVLPNEHGQTGPEFDISGLKTKSDLFVGIHRKSRKSSKAANILKYLMESIGNQDIPYDPEFIASVVENSPRFG